MFSRKQLALAGGVAFLVGVVCTGAWVRAANSDSTLNYAGYLEQDGQPMNRTGVAVEFRVYNATTNALLHTEQRTVNVSGGRFTTVLGPYPQSTYDTAALEVGISVEGVALQGRQRVRPSAFSMHSDVAELSYKANTADNLRNVANFCIMLKAGSTCPAGFNTTTGTTAFAHTHGGVNAHAHGIRVDGISTDTVGCTLDVGGSTNVDCDTYGGGGTGYTLNAGAGLSSAGNGQEWRVCCNY